MSFGKGGDAPREMRFTPQEQASRMRRHDPWGLPALNRIKRHKGGGIPEALSALQNLVLGKVLSSTSTTTKDAALKDLNDKLWKAGLPKFLNGRGVEDAMDNPLIKEIEQRRDELA